MPWCYHGAGSLSRLPRRLRCNAAEALELLGGPARCVPWGPLALAGVVAQKTARGFARRCANNVRSTGKSSLEPELLRSRTVESAFYQLDQGALHQFLGKVHRRFQQFDNLADLVGVRVFVAHGNHRQVEFA